MTHVTICMGTIFKGGYLYVYFCIMWLINIYLTQVFLTVAWNKKIDNDKECSLDV